MTTMEYFPLVKDNQNAGFGQVFSSVLAAMIGVQSDKNRERDFNSANPKSFIIGGVIFTVVFVASIVTVVNLIVS